MAMDHLKKQKRMLNLEDEIVEEIAEKVSGLDAATQRRIETLCEQKLNMTNPQMTQEHILTTEVIEVKNKFSYRSFLAIAACLTLAVSTAGVLLHQQNLKISKEKRIESASQQIPTDSHASIIKEKNVVDSTVSETQKEEQHRTETVSLAEYENTPDTIDDSTVKPETPDTAEPYPGDPEPIEEPIIHVDYNLMIEYFNALNTIATIDDGSLLTVDETQSISVDGTLYYKVIDEQFSSVEEIDDYIDRYMTQNMLMNGDFTHLLNDGTPMYINRDGALYSTGPIIGCGQSYPWVEGTQTISEITEDYFVISAEFENMQEYPTIVITIVQENGRWKMDQFHVTN